MRFYVISGPDTRARALPAGWQASRWPDGRGPAQRADRPAKAEKMGGQVKHFTIVRFGHRKLKMSTLAFK